MTEIYVKGLDRQDFKNIYIYIFFYEERVGTERGLGEISGRQEDREWLRVQGRVVDDR